MKLHFLAEKPHTEYLNKSNQLNETNSQMEDLEVNKTQSIRDLVPYQAKSICRLMMVHIRRKIAMVCLHT